MKPPNAHAEDQETSGGERKAMIKDFLLTRAAPDVPLEKLSHYLQFVHAPLAMSGFAAWSITRKFVTPRPTGYDAE